MALNILPNSGQSLDETRDPIKDNFTYINTGFLANHVELNSGLNSGKHTAVTFTQLAADPTAISIPRNTVAAEVMLYGKADAATNGGTGIFFMGPAGATPFSITARSVSANQVAANTVNAASYTVFPSGVWMQCGIVHLIGSASGGSLVTFGTPFDNVCLNVQLTQYTSGTTSRVAAVVAGSTSKTSFRAKLWNSASGNDNDGDVYWFAIGY